MKKPIVTFFPNKLKSRETFANFISFSQFTHVLHLIKHIKKTKNYIKMPLVYNIYPPRYIIGLLFVRKCTIDAPTVFDVQLLRNPLEYLHEPYTA